MKSIMQSEDKETCYICGQMAYEWHHCWHGTANRKLADKDGLIVKLCHNCHMNLHDKGYFDRELQKLAEVRWMEYYEMSESEFIKRYGKSVI